MKVTLLDLRKVVLLEMMMVVTLVALTDMSLGIGKVQHLVDIQASAHHNKSVRRSNHSENTWLFLIDLMVEHIRMQICHHIPRKQYLDNNLLRDSHFYDIDKDKGLLLLFHFYKHLILRRNNQCFHTDC